MSERPTADPFDRFFFRPDEEAPELGLEPAAIAPVAPAAEEERFLAFRIGGELHAVPLGPVRELRLLSPIAEVPRAPFGVLGVTSVRGAIVPVLDPGLLLGFPPAPRSRAARVVIVDAGRGPVGLLVDGVDGVRRLPPGAVEPVPAGLAAPGEFLRGVGRHRGQLLALLDLPAVVGAIAPAAPRAALPAPGGRP